MSLAFCNQRPFMGSVIFGATDNKQLNKNRININNAFSWALILVPVYLYKRGSILNKTYKIGGFKSQWPLMTWVLFFFLSALLMPV